MPKGTDQCLSNAISNKDIRSTLINQSIKHPAIIQIIFLFIEPLFAKINAAQKLNNP